MGILKKGTVVLCLAALALGVGCTKSDVLPSVENVPADLRPFVDGLRDKKNSDMRWQAARELGLRGVNAAPAVPHLIVALSDPEVKVRRFAVLALGEIGPSARKAIPELERILDDRSQEEIRSAALRSLDRIRGTSPQ